MCLVVPLVSHTCLLLHLQEVCVAKSLLAATTNFSWPGRIMHAQARTTGYLNASVTAYAFESFEHLAPLFKPEKDSNQRVNAGKSQIMFENFKRDDAALARSLSRGRQGSTDAATNGTAWKLLNDDHVACNYAECVKKKPYKIARNGGLSAPMTKHLEEHQGKGHTPATTQSVPWQPDVLAADELTRRSFSVYGEQSSKLPEFMENHSYTPKEVFVGRITCDGQLGTGEDLNDIVEFTFSTGSKLHRGTFRLQVPPRSRLTVRALRLQFPRDRVAQTHGGRECMDLQAVCRIEPLPSTEAASRVEPKPVKGHEAPPKLEGITTENNMLRVKALALWRTNPECEWARPCANAIHEALRWFGWQTHWLPRSVVLPVAKESGVQPATEPLAGPVDPLLQAVLDAIRPRVHWHLRGGVRTDQARLDWVGKRVFKELHMARDSNRGRCVEPPTPGGPVDVDPGWRPVREGEFPGVAAGTRWIQVREIQAHAGVSRDVSVRIWRDKVNVDIAANDAGVRTLYTLFVPGKQMYVQIGAGWTAFMDRCVYRRIRALQASEAALRERIGELEGASDDEAKRELAVAKAQLVAQGLQLEVQRALAAREKDRMKQLAVRVLRSFDVLLLPDFGNAEMGRRGSSISSGVTRRMRSFPFCEVRDTLQVLARAEGRTVDVCSEAYTTQPCPGKS